MKKDFCKQHKVPCTCTSLSDTDECYKVDARAFKVRLDEAFERMNDEDIKFILENQVRQVKWLYNNSNRRTMVYDEKMVRLMIQKLQKRNA